jgi:lysophospholipase L1-like esterase
MPVQPLSSTPSQKAKCPLDEPTVIQIILYFSIMKQLFILLLLFPLPIMAQTSKELKFLALGDSYTIGESVAEKDRWPVQLTARLRAKGIKVSNPKIIATTGWRTDDLKNAILKDNPSKDYDYVSLLIGVNNQYQGKSASSYAPEFEELLKMAIEFAGGNKSKVFVVSIPDYGFTPFGKEKKESITKAIDEFNAVNKSITEKYQIKYFDITPISRKGLEDPELVAADGLHPSGKMYGEWVNVILRGL